LPLLKQTAESPDRNRVLETGNIGTFLSVVHGYRKDEALKLCLG
jgi:hypothetical protein